MKTQMKKVVSILLCVLFAMQVLSIASLTASNENNTAKATTQAITSNSAYPAGTIQFGVARNYTAIHGEYINVTVSTITNNFTYGWAGLSMEVFFDSDVLEFVDYVPYYVPTLTPGQYFRITRSPVGGNWDSGFGLLYNLPARYHRNAWNLPLVTHPPSGQGYEYGMGRINVLFMFNTASSHPRHGTEFFTTVRFRVIGNAGDSSEIMVRAAEASYATQPGVMIDALAMHNELQFNPTYFGLVTVVDEIQLQFGAARDYTAAHGEYVQITISTITNEFTYGWASLSMQVYYDPNVLEFVPVAIQCIPTLMPGQYWCAERVPVGGNWNDPFSGLPHRYARNVALFRTSAHPPSIQGYEDGMSRIHLLFFHNALVSHPRHGTEFYITIRFRVIGNVGDSSEIMVRAAESTPATQPGPIVDGITSHRELMFDSTYFGLVTVTN